MISKKWIAGLGVCALLVSASVVGAQGMERKTRRAGRMGGQGMGRQGGMAKQLGLSDEQKQAFKASREAMQAQNKAQQEEIKKLRAELVALWKVEKPDRSAILAKHEQILAIQRKLTEIRVDHRLKMHASLTPEQRAKAAEAMEKMEARKGQMRQKLQQRFQNRRRNMGQRRGGRKMFRKRQMKQEAADEGDDGDDEGDDDGSY